MNPKTSSTRQPASDNKSLIIEDLPWYKNLFIHSADKFFMNFARANNFNYKQEGSIDMFQLSITKMHGDIDIRNVITGTYHQIEFRLFTAELTLKNVKGGWDDTVIEITLPYPVPQILITHSNENIKESVSMSNGIDITGTFGSFSKINTENYEFNKKISCHIRPGDEVIGLQILTPDVIELLLNNTSSYRDIEIVGNKLYVYLDGLVTKGNKLQSAFDFIGQITPKIRLLSKDFLSMRA
jgi:hypothetical protein